MTLRFSCLLLIALPLLLLQIFPNSRQMRTHILSTGNPHHVTPDQISAYDLDDITLYFSDSLLTTVTACAGSLVFSAQAADTGYLPTGMHYTNLNTYFIFASKRTTAGTETIDGAYPLSDSSFVLGTSAANSKVWQWLAVGY